MVIDSDIKINISRGSFIASAASFGVPLIVSREELSLTPVFNDNITSAEQIAETDSITRQMVNDILTANPSISRVAVLKAPHTNLTADGTKSIADLLTENNNGTWYTVLFTNTDDVSSQNLADIKEISDWYRLMVSYS